MAVEVALAMLHQEGRWLMRLRDETPTIDTVLAQMRKARSRGGWRFGSDPNYRSMQQRKQS